jgi:Tol biopolymer transport system component/DNA-binding winged helix-turn-helix (wHTH) protein
MTAETNRPDLKSLVNLAREADFGLGALRVSPSTREVLRGAERETLEPRVMQVLVALFQANGRVVSRDELIARCWEGRIVGEDAINRAIGQLRRLSEVDREVSFVIETIPRVGYRLLAGLPRETRNGAAALPDILSAGDHISFWRRWRLVAALMLLVVAASATAAWLLWPVQHWTVESSRPFVATLALEGEPAFSPDGKMLAYVSGPDVLSRKIYVRNLAGGEGIKVTSDAYDDASPSWSSDGVRLAYVAQKTGEPCRIMVTTIPAGEAREAGRCAQAEATTIAWQPGTPFLYYREFKGAGRAIFRLDLDTGAKLLVVESKVEGACLCDLHISPDGKSLAYLRFDRVQNDYNIVLRDLTSGTEKILGRIVLRTMSAWVSSTAWSEDSKIVLASSSHGSGSEVIAYPVDGSPPYRVYASATGISRMSIGRGLLAIETNVGRKNLARASLTPITLPDVIDPANGITSSPTFAPDGTLAFLSNRSGTDAIWIMKPGTAPFLLFDAGLQSLGRENFSPDGTRLAVAINTAKGLTIKILTAAGASVASFDVPFLSSGLPTWTPDGKGLILFDSKSQRAVRIAIDNPARREPVAAPLWQAVTIRANGTFATRDDKPGLWRIDHGTMLINDKYPAHWGPAIAFRGDDVLIPDFNAPGGARILAQPVAGGPDRVIAYAPGAEDRRYVSKMTVNPKTGEIIYVASVLSDTNIDLLTLAKR